MARNLYIADWHYDHANILDYDDRPFKTVEEMNDELIKRWNTRAHEDDTVYILGDMFWCSQTEAIPILERLNGKKVLVKGNHDKVSNKDFAGKFENICDYLEIKDLDKHLVLCHYPIPCFNGHTEGWIHLYGHVHNSFEWKMTEHSARMMRELYNRPCEMYNVGAMMPWMGYEPRTLAEILLWRE